MNCAMVEKSIGEVNKTAAQRKKKKSQQVVEQGKAGGTDLQPRQRRKKGEKSSVEPRVSCARILNRDTLKKGEVPT